MKRFAAKLLFQIRIRIGTDNGKRRLCEEQIILIEARSARAALALAKRRGKSQQSSYLNSDGNRVYHEFIGVMDLLHLGPECSNGEVWYEMKQRLLPMERRHTLIPQDSDLYEIRNEGGSTSTQWVQKCD